MAARCLEDLVAFQFAVEFKLAVYAVIDASPRASRSLKFREQLEDAASGIERAVGEGFGRRRPAEFAQFLRYALGSLAEATTCLRDGIHRRYFQEADCQVAFTWGERCKQALNSLFLSQIRKAAELKKTNREAPHKRARIVPRRRSRPRRS